MLGFLRTLLFNVGALCVAYVLCLSGVHKFVYKIGQSVELSEELYRSLDRFYHTTVTHGYQALDAFLKPRLSPEALASIPRLAPGTWKRLVGAGELTLAFLWMTSKWRTAAYGSALIMLTWLITSVSDLVPSQSSASAADASQDNVSFAAFFLALSLLLLAIGPARPPSTKSLARPPAGRR